MNYQTVEGRSLGVCRTITFKCLWSLCRLSRSLALTRPTRPTRLTRPTRGSIVCLAFTSSTALISFSHLICFPSSVALLFVFSSALSQQAVVSFRIMDIVSLRLRLYQHWSVKVTGHMRVYLRSFRLLAFNIVMTCTWERNLWRLWLLFFWHVIIVCVDGAKRLSHGKLKLVSLACYCYELFPLEVTFCWCCFNTCWVAHSLSCLFTVCRWPAHTGCLSVKVQWSDSFILWPQQSCSSTFMSPMGLCSSYS